MGKVWRHIWADCPHKDDLICRACLRQKVPYNHNFKKCERWIATQKALGKWPAGAKKDGGAQPSAGAAAATPQA